MKCCNYFARNVIFFGDDNSLLSRTECHINKFLVLGKGPNFGINGSFGSPEKNFIIDFTKAKKVA